MKKITFIVFLFKHHIFISLFCFAMFALHTPAAANETDRSTGRAVFELIDTYWNAMECLCKINEQAGERGEITRKYIAETEKMKAAAAAISLTIVENVAKNDLSYLKAFSSFYRSLSLPERQALKPVCASVMEKIRSMMAEKLDARIFGAAGIEEFKHENFPGYEDYDPAYIYRRGRELSRETLETYWKEEIKTYETYETIFIEVSEAYFNAVMLHDPSISIISRGQTYEKIINGVSVPCFEVGFRALAKITLKADRKYAKTKVWFELWRNYSYPLPGFWELCGKTYLIEEIYAGNEVLGGRQPAPAN